MQPGLLRHSLIQALHNFVTNTCTIAEHWHRQGNHIAVKCETLPIIIVLEALWRFGDLAFATQAKLRHVYIMYGLAICDSVSIVYMMTTGLPLVLDFFLSGAMFVVGVSLEITNR